MIVVDASAEVSAVLNAGPARAALSSERLHAPHLVDSEVANALRGQVNGRSVSGDAASTALTTWRRLGVTRCPVLPLLDRV